MNNERAIEIIENLLPSFGSELKNSDSTITRLIATANCGDWVFDDFENLKALSKGYGKLEFEAIMWFKSEQDPQKFSNSFKITATVKGKANSPKNDGNWQIENYQIMNSDFSELKNFVI